MGRVRGPRLVIRTGKTPVLQEDEPRQLLDSITGDEFVDLHDRALLSVMLYSFARQRGRGPRARPRRGHAQIMGATTRAGR